MATLQKLRNNAGVLIASVIGLALVAFIMGDLMETGGDNIFQGNQLEITEIAGKSLTIHEFEKRIQRYENYYQQNTREAIDDEIRNAIREHVWQSTKRSLIMQEETGKLGLRVETTELFDLVQGDRPHQLVTNSPFFHNEETGRFDRSRLMTFLRNIDQYDPEIREYWFFIEDNILEDQLFQKYLTLVNKAQFTTTLEAKKRHDQNNTRFDAAFIFSPFNAIEDEKINLTEKQITHHYKKHIEQFKQDASRDIFFTYFDIKPSAEDEKAAQEWIQGIADEFRVSETPVLFINRQSDTAYKGVNYSRGDLPDELDSFAFSSEVGAVYGPFKTRGTYKLARLLDVNQLPDSVQARHILFQPTQNMDQEKTRILADSIYEAILNKEADFTEMAAEYSADRTGQDGGDLGWFTESMMVQPLSDSCFFGQIGKPMLVETQFGVHIVEVTDVTGKKEKRQVGILQREVLPSSETYQKIYAEANTFAGKNRSLEQLRQSVEEHGLQLIPSRSVQENATGLGGFAPQAREIVKWVYEAEEGDVSGTFEVNEKFIIVAVDKVREDGYAPLEDVRAEVEDAVLEKEKATFLLAQFEEASQGITELDKIATQLDLTVHQSTALSYASHTVPQAGTDLAFPAAISVLDISTISPPFSGNKGVYVAELKDKTEANELADYTGLKKSIHNERTSRSHLQIMSTLEEELEVKDMRSKFY